MAIKKKPARKPPTVVKKKKSQFDENKRVSELLKQVPAQYKSGVGLGVLRSYVRLCAREDELQVLCAEATDLETRNKLIKTSIVLHTQIIKTAGLISIEIASDSKSVAEVEDDVSFE